MIFRWHKNTVIVANFPLENVIKVEGYDIEDGTFGVSLVHKK
jgi:hypothetical protein